MPRNSALVLSLNAAFMKKTKPSFNFDLKMMDEKEKKEYAPKCNEDFEFSSVGGFFKALGVRYEQQKEHLINLIADKDEIRQIKREFSNFITVNQCKLLVGHNLSAMGNILVMETIEKIKSKFISKKKPSNKKTPKSAEETNKAKNGPSMPNQSDCNLD